MQASVSLTRFSRASSSSVFRQHVWVRNVSHITAMGGLVEGMQLRMMTP